MQTIIQIQLSKEEFQTIIKNTIKDVFKDVVFKKENVPKETFMTAKQAASYLNIAMPTLYAHTSKKRIKFYKTHRKLYFKKEDLDEFLTNNICSTCDDVSAMNEIKRKRNGGGTNE
jgi:excisionase family DNA binding protein